MRESVAYVKVFRRMKPFCLRGDLSTVELSLVVDGGAGGFPDVEVTPVASAATCRSLLRGGGIGVVPPNSDGSDPSDFGNTQLQAAGQTWQMLLSFLSCHGQEP